MRFVFILVAVLIGLAPSLYAQDEGAIRDSAMRMLGASFLVPAVAVYCDQNIEKNPLLLNAAKQWNRRNALIMDGTVRALKHTGGVSNEEKTLLDHLAFKMTKQFVDSEGNQKQLCQTAVASIEDGSLDLDKRADLAEACRLISSLSK